MPLRPSPYTSRHDVLLHRPVGGDGDYFHTVRRGVNPGDIRVRSRVVGVVYICSLCVDGHDREMGPYWDGTLSSPGDGYFMYDPGQ